jgi:hypothetical protein
MNFNPGEPFGLGDLPKETIRIVYFPLGNQDDGVINVDRSFGFSLSLERKSKMNSRARRRARKAIDELPGKKSELGRFLFAQDTSFSISGNSLTSEWLVGITDIRLATIVSVIASVFGKKDEEVLLIDGRLDNLPSGDDAFSLDRE